MNLESRKAGYRFPIPEFLSSKFDASGALPPKFDWLGAAGVC
jgi:hypothetical protein